MDEFEFTMLDVGSIEEQLKTLTLAITAGNAEDISTFFRDLLIRVRVNERTLNEYKRFIPIIYHQWAVNNEFEDGVFKVNLGPYSSTSQALLMMVPKEGSIVGDNHLVFVRNGDDIKTFDIMKESSDGQLIAITKGDIVPGRTVMFRIISAQTSFPKAVIVNTSGLFSETISNLYVTGEVAFAQKPLIINELDALGNNDRLVSKAELDILKAKVDTIDNKIIITAENAEDVAQRESTPVGAIVYQIEND